MKELRLNYVVGKEKGDISKMVTRRETEIVKNMNYRLNKTHGLKLRKISTKKQVEDEGQRKPRMKAAFQVQQCNGEGTWYTKDTEDYSTASSITFKYEGKDNTKLVRIIAELKEKLATSEKVYIVL